MYFTSVSPSRDLFYCFNEDLRLLLMNSPEHPGSIDPNIYSHARCARHARRDRAPARRARMPPAADDDVAAILAVARAELRVATTRRVASRRDAPSRVRARLRRRRARVRRARDRGARERRSRDARDARRATPRRGRRVRGDARAARARARARGGGARARASARARVRSRRRGDAREDARDGVRDASTRRRASRAPASTRWSVI